jgi:O-methyltransferase
MKNIIHDWDDARARRILLNCRQAVPKDGVLLLVEYRLGEENAPSLGKTLDLVMLTVTGGKERTVSEHRELLASGGFRLNRMIPVSGDVMILEGLPE